MSSDFSLANPSKNLTEYIAQINRLIKLTNGNCTLDTHVGPSLTVDEEFVKQGKKIPAKLHGRITISPKIGFPDAISQRTLEKLNELMYTDEDPVLQGYIKKYNLADTNTFVILYDLSSVNIHLNCISIILSYIDRLNADTTVVFILTGAGAPVPDVINKLKLNMKIKGEYELEINTRITPVLEWGLAVKLASISNNHILANTPTSTMCAKINSTKERNVWSPVPLVDGSQPDSILSWYGVHMPMNSTRMFDWIYYINMDKRTDRREHMERQLAKFNLAAARVSAVDGKSLEWHQQLGTQTTYWNHGALGYCISYQNALIDAIKNNYQRILIMDDDAVLTDNFLDVLSKAYDSLPNDWHLLYLAANHSKESMPTAQERVSDSLYKMKGSVGSHAIIINRPAFETILNFASTPYSPLDVYLSVYQQVCPCYIVYPGLATQMAGHSDIINKEVDYTKDWGVDYINHIDYLKPSKLKELTN